MSDKITRSHLDRAAYVYVRQSSPTQVARNRESTARQYNLVERAVGLGWRRDNVRVIDEDQAISGSGTEDRGGFEVLAGEVGLRRVGIVLATEVSRVARSNAEWYHLLDFCGVTNTLIADEEGVYHPGLYNDRLLLGLKGTMSEAELYIIRARLNGGIWNKAERGELECGLPIGFIWKDGTVCLDPDEAVRNAISTVFDKFAETGSIRRVWIWFRTQGLPFPSRPHKRPEVRWIVATYAAVRAVLINPVYAGAYRFGRTKHERHIDKDGRVRNRTRILPRSEWPILIKGHHPGYVDWETYEMNQSRIERNAPPTRDQAGGAIREGSALLQGLAACGRCGRPLRVRYRGKNSTATYRCGGPVIVEGKAADCMRVGGVVIDRAVAGAVLEAITPAGVEAAFEVERAVDADHDAAIAQWHLQVERAEYEAGKAERRYRLVEPENRLVARGLEAEWERRLAELAAAKAQLEDRKRRRPHSLTEEERAHLRALGSDLRRVWSASTTTDRDRKELINALLEEVIIARDRGADNAHLTLRWRGGLVTELDLGVRSPKACSPRTSEDDVELLRRLAPHYSNAVIAAIMNKQGRRTARGAKYTAARVSGLKRSRGLPAHNHTKPDPDAPAMTVAQAAEALGVNPSTVHRCLNDGIIIGEKLTPGAPWRIRMTKELRDRFVKDSPEGYVPMADAMRILGVSRQTILQRVKRGQLQALHVSQGRRKGLRIKVLNRQLPLFDDNASKGVQCEE
jgi:DNA invertase Pin-like site-specific DNA recombinase